METQIIDKKHPRVWYLYGKAYDLTEFMPLHPGGPTIQKIVMNHYADVTPMFEMCHSLSDIKAIRKKLSSYEIEGYKGKEQPYTFKEGDFYQVLKKRVKKLFYKDGVK